MSEIERWFPYINNNPKSKIRLFCLPYAGSNSLIYKSWPGLAPGFLEICPVELPGRGRRLAEPVIDKTDILVEKLSQVICQALEKPFAIFGHSMGALLGFELTKKLSATYGETPVHLFVSAHRAPQEKKAEEDLMYNLPEPEFIQRLRELHGMPQEILEHQELMNMLMPILRADFTVCETYEYQYLEPVNCPITAFGGLADESVTRELLEPWRLQTNLEFQIRMFPGDHFFILQSNQVLVEQISNELQDQFKIHEN